MQGKYRMRGDTPDSATRGVANMDHRQQTARLRSCGSLRRICAPMVASYANTTAVAISDVAAVDAVSGSGW